MKKKKGKKGKKNSVQELLGIQWFTKYGIMTDHGELVFFQIAPTNISVLSYANIEMKINHLQGLISMQPDLEIVCTDSCECFDGNREYLRRRAQQEANPKVRTILEQDREMLSQMQSEMSNARQFYLVMRLKAMKSDMVFTAINDARKRMAEKGFETHRLTKPEIKRFLAIYLEASMDGDKMPDVDGGQYVKEVRKDGYLKSDLKAMVDQIVMELAKDERIQSLYDLWYEQRKDVLRTYTDTFPERIPLEQNREFKTIRNMVIQEPRIS